MRAANGEVVSIPSQSGAKGGGRALADEPTLLPSESSGGARTGDSATARDDDELPRGTVLSRYVILQKVGAGGMGVVYAAYDPQLDRRVALKLLSTKRSIDTRGRSRMLREAQAMARLTHPNVVAVHDIGAVDGRTFIAMEYIEGQTIKAWLAAAPRPWRTVLRVYISAGRGLVAAHAGGLVHRDFKPDNVMLSAPGLHGENRVLVTDFGLAREHDTDEVMLVSGELDDGTRTGTLAGTPRYMAPEQFGGNAGDQRSDQFSFCVALFEGLFGERPFAGDSYAALADSVMQGRTNAMSAKSGVPGHIRKAVLRGLAADPSQRHESMTALLAALEHDPWKGRKIAIVCVGIGTLLAGAIATPLLVDPERRRCENGAKAIDEVWNDERSEAIAAQFVATGVPLADERWTSVAPTIGAHVEGWRAMYLDACLATHVRGEQSGERLDVRMRCLQDDRERLDALLGELATPDADLIERAARAVSNLPEVEACRDPDLQAFAAIDPADEERVARARHELAIAKARNDAGRYAQGVAATDQAIAELGELALPWLRADIGATRGQLQLRGGDATAAEATLRATLVDAVAGDRRDLAARAWIELLFVVSEQGRPNDALAMELAATLAVHADGDDPVMQRRLETVLGIVYQAAGKLEEARVHHEAALAIAQVSEAGPLVLEVLHANYGNTLYELGRFQDAYESHERALELAIGELGERHPAVAIDLMNLARDAADLGAVEKAREMYLRSLALREELLGPDSRGAGESLINLAVLEYGQLELDAARKHGERALANFEKTAGKDHPLAAAAHNNLGNIAHAQGDLERALGHYDRMKAIYESRFGVDHPRTAIALTNSANVLIEREAYDEAIARFDRALAIEEKALGP
ncbi:MAG TPA: serine/threonine-protein kinase, partial [Nannocystaceae bacterium]|nr:serine/threonine-protein kinase [Nannocystaceae bacterium]